MVDDSSSLQFDHEEHTSIPATHDAGQFGSMSSHARRGPLSDPTASRTNRLDVVEGETAPLANCNIVGLLPFGSERQRVVHEHALAIQLAIRHLNTGDDSLVTALLGLRDRCPINFSASYEDVTKNNPSRVFQVVDSLTRPVVDFNRLAGALNTTHTEELDRFVLAAAAASRGMSEEEYEVFLERGKGKGNAPCAFLGGLDSDTSKTTALVTGMRGIPQISPSSTSDVLNDRTEYPLFGRTVPDDTFLAQIFIRFLHEELNVRHIYVIYESHPYTEALRRNLRDAIYSEGWAPSANETDDEQKEMFLKEYSIGNDGSGSMDFDKPIEDLKISQYRFVIALTVDRKTTDGLLQVAYDHQLAGYGTHHWWFPDTASSAMGNHRPLPKNSSLAKAYNGTGSIQPISKSISKQYQLFVEQSRSLKKELYANGDYGGWDTSLFLSEVPFMNESDWFQESEGYGFDYPMYSYDATILLGLSACREVNDPGGVFPLHLSGKAFFDRITATNFTGLTGQVLLKGPGEHGAGTRNGDSVPYSIKNWRAIDDENDPDTIEFVDFVTHTYMPGGDDKWDTTNQSFIYNNGETELPPINPGLPPSDPKFNYVDTWIRVLAPLLCGIVLLATIGFAVWTFIHRKTRVVMASQPFFLYLICVGIAVMALSMIPISLSHSNDYNGELVCNSTVWLVVIGFGITFSTLFAKTYRINKIMAGAMECRRVKLTVQDTIYPVALIWVFNVVILSLMMKYGRVGYKEFTTEREDTFGRPLEEYSRCVYRDALGFLVSIAAVNLSMVGLALVQAWMARYLSTEFSESTHIAHSLGLSFVASVLACPVLLIVKDRPDVNTFIITTLVFVLTTSTLCFIFVPKVLFYRNEQNNRNSAQISTLARRMSRYSSASNMSGGGDQILTMKPQQKLLAEIRSLQKELADSQRRERLLETKNSSLEKRLQEKASGNGNSSTNEGASSSNGLGSKDASMKSVRFGETVDNVSSDLSDYKSELSMNGFGLSMTDG